MRLFVSYVDERGVQPGHDLLDFSQIDIADGKSRFAFFLVQFDKTCLSSNRAMVISLEVTLIINSLFISCLRFRHDPPSSLGDPLRGRSWGEVITGCLLCNKPKDPEGLFRFIILRCIKYATYFFFLCLSFLRRFSVCWVDILCLFLFLPLGMIEKFNK